MARLPSEMDLGDPDVEAFFIDYFVNLEEPPSVRGSAQEEMYHSGFLLGSRWPKIHFGSDKRCNFQNESSPDTRQM